MNLGDAFRTIKEEIHGMEESGKDFIAGISEDRAMSEKDRHVDEFKILAGISALFASIAELGPFAFFAAAPAAVVPTVEGVKDITEHGHALRRAL